MKALQQIVAVSVMAVLLTAGAASAYVYGYDPAKAAPAGDSYMYMELAQDPTYINDGVYAGKYEYFFDMYTLANGAGSTFYFLHLAGLDNSKIANAQTVRPDAGTFKTQRWGDPNGAYEAWPDVTGRVLDFWDKGRNQYLSDATQFDVSRTSYSDGGAGWTDSGLGYAGSSTANPHAYSEYVPFSGSSAEIWKAELTGPGQPLHWWNTQFGVAPAIETIYIAGSTAWSTTATAGLTFTMRIVYDEPIDPLTIGWSGDGTLANTILGDFTVTGPPEYDLGDVDEDGDIDGDDIDMLADYIRTGVRPGLATGECDLSIDGLSEGTDAAVDINDLNYLVHFLVETSLGNGTEFGDFNLDGVIDATDLTRIATYFGPGTTWAQGNANRNIDLTIDTTDLTILGTYYGFSSADAIPEPMTISVLALGAIGVLRRRRR